MAICVAMLAIVQLCALTPLEKAPAPSWNALRLQDRIANGGRGRGSSPGVAAQEALRRQALLARLRGLASPSEAPGEATQGEAVFPQPTSPVSESQPPIVAPPRDVASPREAAAEAPSAPTAVGPRFASLLGLLPPISLLVAWRRNVRQAESEAAVAEAQATELEVAANKLAEAAVLAKAQAATAAERAEELQGKAKRAAALWPLAEGGGALREAEAEAAEAAAEAEGSLLVGRLLSQAAEAAAAEAGAAAESAVAEVAVLPPAAAVAAAETTRAERTTPAGTLASELAASAAEATQLGAAEELEAALPVTVGRGSARSESKWLWKGATAALSTGAAGATLQEGYAAATTSAAATTATTAAAAPAAAATSLAGPEQGRPVLPPESDESAGGQAPSGVRRFALRRAALAAEAVVRTNQLLDPKRVECSACPNLPEGGGGRLPPRLAALLAQASLRSSLALLWLTRLWETPPRGAGLLPALRLLRLSAATALAAGLTLGLAAAVGALARPLPPALSPLLPQLLLPRGVPLAPSALPPRLAR